MTCKAQKPNGANFDCVSFLKEAVAMIVADAGTLSFDNSYALDNAENWRVKFQESETAMIIPINGSEVAKAEPQVETTGNGSNFVAGENAGNIMAYIDSNACDYNEVLKYFKSGTHDLMWLDADGQLLGYNTGSSLDGYKVRLYAANYGGVGSRENQSQQFAIRVDYVDNAEQNSPFIYKIGFTKKKLMMYVPAGVTLNESTAYNTGTGVIVMDIFRRCTTTAYDDTTLTNATGKVINVTGQADSSGITVTPAWNGATNKWDITIADGVGQLAAGVTCEFRIEDKTGSVLNYVSNTKTVTGA